MIGASIGVTSFFTIPSAKASSCPKATASTKSSNAITTSIQSQAGAVGTSSATTIPVVP